MYVCVGWFCLTVSFEHLNVNGHTRNLMLVEPCFVLNNNMTFCQQWIYHVPFVEASKIWYSLKEPFPVRVVCKTIVEDSHHLVDPEPDEDNKTTRQSKQGLLPLVWQKEVNIGRERRCRTNNL